MRCSWDEVCQTNMKILFPKTMPILMFYTTEFERRKLDVNASGGLTLRLLHRRATGLHRLTPTLARQPHTHIFDHRTTLPNAMNIFIVKQYLSAITHTASTATSCSWAPPSARLSRIYFWSSYSLRHCNVSLHRWSVFYWPRPRRVCFIIVQLCPIPPHKDQVIIFELLTALLNAPCLFIVDQRLALINLDYIHRLEYF